MPYLLPGNTCILNPPIKYRYNSNQIDKGAYIEITDNINYFTNDDMLQEAHR